MRVCERQRWGGSGEGHSQRGNRAEESEPDKKESSMAPDERKTENNRLEEPRACSHGNLCPGR